ncbi:MAG: DUF4440 domain-containing protein [Pseudomonadota bacterium]
MIVQLESITEHIKQRELKLLQIDLKADPALIDDLLSDEFEEISGSGQVNSRNNVVYWLRNKDNHIQWLLIDFRIKVLTDDLVMAIYTAQKLSDPDSTSKGSMRTSIWKCQEGNWRMLFHQASKIN